METIQNYFRHILVLLSVLMPYVSTQQCSQVIKEHFVNLNNYTVEDITLSCPTGFTVNMQYVKLVQAWQAPGADQIMVECVIEPIYQYHSLCLHQQECVLSNPDYYKSIRGCNDQRNGTNYFIMEYFCDAAPQSAKVLSLCEQDTWTGSQLYLYSSLPGTPAITSTNCKCIITLSEQSEMVAYVGSFTKESSIDGFDLNYNPCQQKVQMTTFEVFETTYVQRSFCSRFAGLARETCSDNLKIIYIQFDSVTPWVSVNFSFSFTAPVDKPMKVECGITEPLGRPTNPPPPTTTTTTTTTTAAPTTTTTTATTTTTTDTPTTTTQTTTSTTTETPTTTTSTTSIKMTTTTSAAITTTPESTSKDTTSTSQTEPVIIENSTTLSPKEAIHKKDSNDFPLELVIGATAGVTGVFILVGVIAAAVCARRNRKTDKATESGSGAAAQLSGDGSVYHVYEYVEGGARLSGAYAQADNVSTPPAYPTYPRPAPDTLSSTPGYLIDDPPPDYPMDTLENQRNERIQNQANNRWMSHVNDDATSPKKHTRFDKDVEYMEQKEDDVAHNPLYGKAHDLFFAY